MEEFREGIYEELVKILCDNYKLFPIVKQIRASEQYKVKSKGEDLEYRTWYAVRNHIALNVVFSRYYEALEMFWYGSSVYFKDEFKYLVISKCLCNYLPGIPSSRKEAAEIQELLEKFRYKPKV